MSFRDVSKNLNLGVCVVEADDEPGAIGEAWLKDANPGGEVLMFKMTEEEFSGEGLERNRLYSRDEMNELGFEWVSDRHLPPRVLDQMDRADARESRVLRKK